MALGNSQQASNAVYLRFRHNPPKSVVTVDGKELTKELPAHGGKLWARAQAGEAGAVALARTATEKNSNPVAYETPYSFVSGELRGVTLRPDEKFAGKIDASIHLRHEVDGKKESLFIQAPLQYNMNGLDKVSNSTSTLLAALANAKAGEEVRIDSYFFAEGTNMTMADGTKEARKNSQVFLTAKQGGTKLEVSPETKEILRGEEVKVGSGVVKNYEKAAELVGELIGKINATHNVKHEQAEEFHPDAGADAESPPYDSGAGIDDMEFGGQ